MLDGASNYYGGFADSFEGSDYTDPAVQSSNEVGRTALRQGRWRRDGRVERPGIAAGDRESDAKLVVGGDGTARQDGMRIPGASLNNTATSMNNNAEKVQEACAAAGTHA